MGGSGNTNNLKKFRVDVGHSSVTVECSNEAEAIPQAKRQLSKEVPRMWDLIQGLGDERFRVSPLQQND